MSFLRNKRGSAALVALLAVVGLTLWVVLPALGATVSGYPGAVSADQHISPTYLASGGENDCALFTAHGATIGTDQYFASNPKAISGKAQTVTATNGMTVTFTVTVDAKYVHLAFSVSGAIVTDVGIKGGNGTDWYNYEGATGGGVTHDSGLTAPAQSANYTAPFYGLSQTVFCYTPKITCQPGVALSDSANPGETIELPSCAGKTNAYFDFGSGTTDGKPWVSVYSYGGTGTSDPLVEHITGTLPDDAQPTLQYSDSNPPTPDTIKDMLTCQIDPRAGGTDPLALAQPVPDPSAILQDGETSCLISERTWIDASGGRHFEAYVYSDIDGYRTY